MVDTSGAENPQDYGLSEEQAQRIATRSGFSPSQFRQQSQQVQQQMLRRIRYDNLPRLRAEFSALFLRGDEGEIAPDGYARAAERLLEMRTTSHGRVAGMSVGPLPEGPLPPVLKHEPGVVPNIGSWISYGPGNIGGRIRSILISIEDGKQKIYIGSAGGGIWTTTDTVTWQLADASMANLAVCSMAMAPNNRTTIYAGTGEGYSGAFDGLQGNGIFKTTDGRVWQQLASTRATDTNKDFLWVNGVATSSDGTVVLAGTRTGIFRSADGGATWTSAMSANVGNILFNPTNDMKCIAGMLAGGGIRYSEDGGATWKTPAYPSGSPAFGRIQVCYAARDANIVYASVETTPASGAGSQIWQSTDGGKTFSKKNSATNYLGSQGGYANIIWAGDPTDSNFVIVGGFNLYKSIDGGNTLTQISDGTIVPRSAHVDHHMIRADIGYNGTSNKTVYFANDGGLYMTWDVKTVGNPPPPLPPDPLAYGWISLNSNLPITQFYSVSGTFTTVEGTTTISSIVGGTQDNGTLRYTPIGGTNGWKKWATGDGGNVGVDAQNSLCYGEAPFLEVYRSTSTTGEMTADDICGYYYNSARRAWAWKAPPYCIPDAQSGSSAALFIAPLVAIRQGQSLLAGGASLWRTDDPRTPNTDTAGPSWRSIKGPVAGAKVSAIFVAQPVDDRYFLVGYSNGQIFGTEDSGQFWSAAGANIGATRPCTSVAVDNREAWRRYATFSGFQTSNIWTSGVAGLDWYSLGDALPPVPIYCVTAHPQKSEWLYLGTAIGIFASEDGGFTWAPNNEGPINCIVQQFVWMGNTLCCATYGRGSFAIDLTLRADLLVTGDAAGNLVASNAVDGTVVSGRTIPGGQITAPPLIDDTSVYLAYTTSTSPRACGVSKFNNAHDLRQLAWLQSLPATVNAIPSLVKAIYPGDRDALYVFASDGKLYAFDAWDGNPHPSLQVVPSGLVGTGVTAYSSQAMGQSICIATDKGLYAVDIRLGVVTWSRPDLICSAPALLAPGTLFAPAQSTIYAIQAHTGAASWSYNTGGVIRSKPVVAETAIVAGNQNGRLVGLRGDTGAQQFTVNYTGAQIQAITADRGVVYFVANSAVPTAAAQLNCIVPYATGFNYRWRVTLTAGSSSPPQIFGTSLYLTTLDGKLQSFNASDGGGLWQQTLSGAIPVGPAVCYA